MIILQAALDICKVFCGFGTPLCSRVLNSLSFGSCPSDAADDLALSEKKDLASDLLVRPNRRCSIAHKRRILKLRRRIASLKSATLRKFGHGIP